MIFNDRVGAALQQPGLGWWREFEIAMHRQRVYRQLERGLREVIPVPRAWWAHELMARGLMAGATAPARPWFRLEAR